MAINFPSSPTNGQTHSHNGITWTFNSATGAWAGALSGTPLEIKTAAPSANQNDFAISGMTPSKNVHTVLEVAPTVSMKFTGIDSTGMETGKVLTIRNTSSGAGGRLIILEYSSTGSSAANRFLHQLAMMPIMLMPLDEVTFRFDGTQWAYMFGSRPLSVKGFFDKAVDGAYQSANYNSGTGATGGFGFNTTEANGEVIVTGQNETGTDTTGRGTTAVVPSAGMRAGLGSLLFYAQVRPDALSDATNEYDLRAGFQDGFTTVNDGIFFEYDRNNSVNWNTVTMSNGTATRTSLGVAASATDFIRFGCYVNPDASRADFFYSTDQGVTWNFGTAHTANIPTGTARAFGAGVVMLKSAGTTNTTFKTRFHGIRSSAR